MHYCNLAGPTIDWLVDELGLGITEAVLAPELRDHGRENP